MSAPDPQSELEELKLLLAEKDATIANLQKKVAQGSVHCDEQQQVPSLQQSPAHGSAPETPRSMHRSPITHSKSDIERTKTGWSEHNPFAAFTPAAIDTRVPTGLSAASTSALPPITPILAKRGVPNPQQQQPNTRRRTIAPGQLASLQAQLNNMRRSTSVSIPEDHVATPPLLAAPSAEHDWTDDNPFAFLKTPAPAPPTVHHQHTHSHVLAPRLPPSEINSSGETLPPRKRPRSQSTSPKGKVRFEIMAPPPPLVPPPLPLEMKDLKPDEALKLQLIQAYFRGRIERAKVKHMVEKQVMGRRFTMEEILLSERRYVHHLDLIVTLFLRPLQKTDLLTPAEFSAIFMNVEKLHTMARSFLRQLEDLFSEDPLVIGHRVGLLFLNTIPEWRSYSYFVNHFEYAQIQLTKCKERRSFRDWFHKAESHASLEKLGMMDYMIAAAKRVPQYHLLLKAVKKNTPKASRHYQTIKTAKTMINELAQFLNDRKRSFDNMRKIELIQRSLNGKIPNLLTPGREYVSEAVVKEEDPQARLIIDRRIFLFNDCLLVATASNNKFDRLIYLAGSEMSARAPRKVSLRIDDIALVVVFQTEPEKTRWVALLGHAIETLAFQEQESALKDFAPSGLQRPKVLQSVILHQGYLLKHRRSSGGWNKRWFILEQGVLYYVKNPAKAEDITERGTIDLCHYAIRGPLDWTSGSKRRHGFELNSRTRPIFVLASEDSRSRDEWVRALRPFLLSSQSSEREGVLYAASTSSDIARTSSSSRVLLPNYKPAPDVDPDLIQWSDSSSSAIPSSSDAGTSHQPLSVSSKFYFNEDYMDRTSADYPDPDWFTQASQLPASPSKTHPLRRSLSSSSVPSS